ncbi:TetR/AcrR family transcriptional regulator [Oleispirillum naphthae]|uniref:TetR/AcrR family transcriptional regulator n=1 Tax=Oleispirillum naphthae TaxID=2838853 RepID=UPI0030825F78
MPRWTQRPEDRPGEIIAAALALFAEKGFAATRVEEIAARAGLSKAGVYLYFPTKAEIFKATVRETILTTVSRLEAMAQAFDGSSEELLRRVITEMARMVGGSAAGAIPRIVLSEAGNFPDIAEFYVKEVVSRGLTVVSGIIARGQARGEFAADLGPLTPFIAIAPILTLSMWNHGLGRVLNRPLPTGMFAEDMFKVIGRGLRTEGGR